MHRMSALLLSVFTVAALLGGTAVATGNQPPLADAGLDQSVERGATVQLDANGSRDPDGRVAAVEWSIEAPDGTTRTPDCPTCIQTTFSPADTGQYNVTITVTDDAGVSRSDTLRVDVVAAGGPSVSVSAPTALPTGSRRNLTANVSAGDADLRTLAWVVNGTAQNRTRLTGENGTSTITHTFNDSGFVSVRAVAYDAAGRRGVANQTVRVVDSSGGGGGGSRNSCPGGSGNYYVDGQNQGCTSAAMTIEDTIVDTDGRDGLWVYMDNELTQVISEDNMNKYSEDGYGGTFSKETVNEQKEKIRQKRKKGNDGGGSGDDNGSSSGDDDDDQSSSGSARSASSVPNNLMNPGGGGDNDDASLPNEPSVGNDNPFDSSDDDDGGLFNDGSYGDDSGGSGHDDSSIDDSSDDDDDGLLGGGGLLGGSDDNDDDGDGDDDGSDDGGGWSFW